MSTLWLKLLLTPGLIVAVSLAGRRWGPAVSGWLTGLPLTSGPVALYFALDQGPTFAAEASVGILGGLGSVAAFGWTYSCLAYRARWPATVIAGFGVFVGLTWFWRAVSPDLPTTVIGVTIFLVAALWRMPRPASRRLPPPTPWWDLPARALVATVFVLVVTGIAQTLGPRLSGLISPLPVMTATLAVFTHQLEGASAVAALMRGVVVGSFAFAAFVLVVAVGVENLGIGVTFTLATILAVLVQGASGRLLPK